MSAVEAAAMLATRMRFEHAHPHEPFGELWIDGRFQAFCANAGTALVMAAARLGIEPGMLEQITKGMQG